MPAVCVGDLHSYAAAARWRMPASIGAWTSVVKSGGEQALEIDGVQVDERAVYATEKHKPENKVQKF